MWRFLQTLKREQRRKKDKLSREQAELAGRVISCVEVGRSSPGDEANVVGGEKCKFITTSIIPNSN